MTIKKAKIVSWGVGIIAFGLLAGCATSEDPAAPSSATKSAHTEHGEGGHEPRLVIATDEGVSVRSLETGEVLADFEAGSAPLLTLATDQRHLYATDLTSGQTRIVDSGTWADDHGDHQDFATADPKLLDVVLSATKPTHVVVGADQVAIYDDATGTASFYDEYAVLGGNTTPVVKITASSPHHGIALPERDRYLVSAVATEGDTIAGGVGVYNLEGALLNTQTDCPRLHGAAVAGPTTVFGCADGLLTMSAEGAAAKLAYPRADDWRVGSFAAPLSADTTHILGHYGPADSTNVLVTDLTTGTSKALDIGAPYGSMIAINENQVAVSAITGEVVIVDLVTASVAGRHKMIEPWVQPEGHAGGAPALAVNGETIYLTNPAAMGVNVLDLDSGKTTTIDLGVAATSLLIANPDDTEPHDH